MFEFKNEDIEEARNIALNLDLPDKFGCDGDCDFYTGDIEQQIASMVSDDFYVTNGATKVVISIEHLPFVIKIPFNGKFEYTYNYEYDEETEELYKIDEDIDDVEFIPFTQANAIVCDDYCYDECQVTREFQDNDYDMFVPEMKFLCDCGNHAIYIQEKVFPLCENRNKYKASEDSFEKAKDIHCAFTTEWVAKAIDLYGVEFFEGFLAWVHVTDIHSGNYGYNNKGEPVIFDLSGYRD